MAKIGTQVKAGDVLATLVRDSLTQSTLQSNLVSAQENLDQLTSPAAIASAQAAVAADEQTLNNAQISVANLNYHNPGAIANAQAALTLAQSNLEVAQNAYDQLGLPASDPAKARAYQALYAAQQKYNSALYTYNLFPGMQVKHQLTQPMLHWHWLKRTWHKTRTIWPP